MSEVECVIRCMYTHTDWTGKVDGKDKTRHSPNVAPEFRDDLHLGLCSL
jgi:hypothetical protein